LIGTAESTLDFSLRIRYSNREGGRVGASAAVYVNEIILEKRCVTAKISLAFFEELA
jgi:hypothetical protein